MLGLVSNSRSLITYAIVILLRELFLMNWEKKKKATFLSQGVGAAILNKKQICQLSNMIKGRDMKTWFAVRCIALHESDAARTS